MKRPKPNRKEKMDDVEISEQAQGECDSCRKVKPDVRAYSDRRYSANISLCADCSDLSPVNLSVVVIASKSRASQDALIRFIKNSSHRICAIVITTQLRGSIVARLVQFLRICRSTSLRFVGYKIADRMVGNRLELAAMSRGVRVIKTTSVNSQSTIGSIRSLNPDLIVSVFANQIFHQPLLNSSRLGVLNVHGSLLPHYRGPAQYYWYLKNKDSQGGVTVHYMDTGVDTGDIVKQRPFEIAKSDTMQSLHKRIADIGCDLVSGIIAEMHAGKFDRSQQPATTEQPLTMPK